MVNRSITRFDRDMCLMLKASRGDRVAFGRIYRKYFQVVFNYIVKLDGRCSSHEDLAQEVFVRVWQNIAKYRPNSTVKTFLFGYAKNVLLEENFRVANKTSSDICSSPNTNTNRLQFGTRIVSDDIINSIRKTVASLPNRQRQAFELVYIRNFSPAKAAEVLRCSTQSIHLNLHRAWKKLRESILPL